MKTLIIFFAIAIGLLAIGFATVPFILASILELSWINWLGIITIPCSFASIIMLIMQIKVILNGDDPFK
jgi:uncharacterized phage infection (PIP) family protein YhgE